MDDTSKCLTHASISTSGVTERSGVVGAVSGQIEGPLDDELDLRDLQQSPRVGRVDVQVDPENGYLFGQMTITSSLDKVETTVLAASLETLTRVDPYQAVIGVTNIKDVREAKRRMVAKYARKLLAESFDDIVMSSTEVLEAIKENVRVEDIAEYQGLPADPRVADPDVTIAVEGRVDVLILLRYDIKSVIAVEETNVPDVVTGLTQERTVTVFLDGDRGGEFILRGLSQIGDANYVALVPNGRSAESLDRASIVRTLRNKAVLSPLPDDGDRDFRVAVAAVNGTRAGGAPANPHTESSTTKMSSAPPADGPINGLADAVTNPTAKGGNDGTVAVERPANAASENPATDDDATDAKVLAESEADAVVEVANPADKRPSLTDHMWAVIADESGMARLLNDDLDIDDGVAVEKACDTTEYADPALTIVVVNGEASQKLVNIAVQRGVGYVVARSAGEYVKKPVSIRVRIADQLLD